MTPKPNRLQHEQGSPTGRGVLARIGQRLGLMAIAADTEPVARVRPAVEPYNPRSGGLHLYAARNANLAGIPTTGSAGQFSESQTMQLVGSVADAYDGYLRGIYRKSITSRDYGFSAEHPRTLFKWDASEQTAAVADELLYVLGAEPTGEPRSVDHSECVAETRQDYVSSAGLHFVDTRVAVQGVSGSDERHQLMVYLPLEEDGNS